MAKTSSSQRLGKRNRKKRRECFKKMGAIHGFRAKRLMQGRKRTVQEWKGAVGSGKGRTVFQLMLITGPPLYEVSEWAEKIAYALEITQKEAEIMVRKARALKEEEGVVLKESKDKTDLEKVQKQITAGFFGIPAVIREITN